MLCCLGYVHVYPNISCSTQLTSLQYFVTPISLISCAMLMSRSVFLWKGCVTSLCSMDNDELHTSQTIVLFVGSHSFPFGHIVLYRLEIQLFSLHTSSYKTFLRPKLRGILGHFSPLMNCLPMFHWLWCFMCTNTMQ